MKQTPRIIALLMLVTILIACGTSTPSAPASTAVPAEATAAPEVTAAPEPTAVPEPTTASEPTTAAEASTTTCEAGYRYFEHELLESAPLCIPEQPQRVLPLDLAAVEVMLVTGQTPVGTAQWLLDELPLLLPQYAETLATFEGVGYPADLEQVAKMKPDLILTTSDSIDIELASKIAPVVVAKQEIYEDWKLGMRFWSDVMNVPELYTEMEANYQTRVEELQKAIGNPADLKISLISVSTYGISLWMPDTTPGRILTDVGFSRPESQTQTGDEAVSRYGEKQYIPISEERLDLADGDAIFYFTYAAVDPTIAEAESAFIKTFQEKPVWNSLNAVKAGKAFFVPGYWWRSQTYLLANLALDDLFANLTDTTATTPVLTFDK